MQSRLIHPDRKHYTMAMQTCVTSNQCGLAEEIINMLVSQNQRQSNSKDRNQMDAVLCSLWLRALLQQGRWTSAFALLDRMRAGGKSAPPPPPPPTTHKAYTNNTTINTDLNTDTTHNTGTHSPTNTHSPSRSFTDALPQPNQQTYCIILQFQILAGRTEIICNR
jgi:pentatricopeptide repeat protein